MLVEEHAQGRVLVRIARRLRVTPFFGPSWRASPALLANAGDDERAGGWLAGAVAVVVGLTLRASWHAAATIALADTVMTRVLVDAGAMPLWTPATTGAAHANAAVAATPPVAVASTRHAH